MLSDTFTTNYMGESRALEANGRSAGQKFPRLLWYSTVINRVRKSPPKVTVMSMMDLFYILMYYFFKIWFHIIFSFISSSGIFSSVL
jgi:hypothetical protein